MAMANKHGKDVHPDETEHRTNILFLVLIILSGILGAIGAVYAAIEMPTAFKLVVLVLLILFWILFDCHKRVHTATLDLIGKAIQQREETADLSGQEAQAPAVRWALGGLILLFLFGWGYGEAAKPPSRSIAESIYYMVVLDASETMMEPFDGYPSKWSAVQTAFQRFLDRSNPQSNYGLVLLGGRNPFEENDVPCSLPTAPLIPLVSDDGKVFPQKKLSLPHLQDQIAGQQPQGSGSLSRAFFLARNQLEALPPEASRVIVLIANAGDTCEGKIDWDKFANDIQLVNKAINVHKELILIDVEATQDAVAFAEQMNALDEAAGTSNTFVQVVQTYYQLEMSISFVLERIESAEAALQAAATATAQGEKSPELQTVVGAGELATPLVLVTQPRRVIVAVSATSTPSLTPTATSTFTPTLTSTSTCTPTATLTYTPTSTYTATTPAPIISNPIVPRDRDDDDDDSSSPPPEDTCCKHCGSDSQPCGDSCIALGLTCHQPSGCACP